MIESGAFPENVAKALFTQLLEALDYCHQRGVYHRCVGSLLALDCWSPPCAQTVWLLMLCRDVKPSNILVDGDYRLKLADFGLVAFQDETLQTNCGTFSYMAPEVVRKDKYDGAKADSWSCGVVLMNFLTFAPPFNIGEAPSTRRPLGPQGSHSASRQRGGGTGSSTASGPRSGTSTGMWSATASPPSRPRRPSWWRACSTWSPPRAPPPPRSSGTRPGWRRMSPPRRR
jgi:serine/threonine protein kinase